MSYEPYPDDDGTMLRECKGCAGEYAIRTDDALESAGLVGEGCPYRSVQQFAYELLNLAQPGQLPAGFVERAIQAAQLLDPALLSSGSNP